MGKRAGKSGELLLEEEHQAWFQDTQRSHRSKVILSSSEAVPETPTSDISIVKCTTATGVSNPKFRVSSSVDDPKLSGEFVERFVLLDFGGFVLMLCYCLIRDFGSTSFAL